MTFKQSLEKLGIQEFEQRILNSNSHGELIHLAQYIVIAEFIADEHINDFGCWFKAVIDEAEKTWERPESVFQHIGKILKSQLTEKTK